MSRAVRQCVDQFLKDHKIILFPWQYKAMLEILSHREIYRSVPYLEGKTYLFETIELFLKERTDHVKSEISNEESFNQL